MFKRMFVDTFVNNRSKKLLQGLNFCLMDRKLILEVIIINILSCKIVDSDWLRDI